jgi:chromosome segregation ATPase
MHNICAFDGKPFEATRADARYCSAACRAKASKARRREEGAMAEAYVDVPVEGAADIEDRQPKPSGDDARIDKIERRLADLESDFDVAEARVLSVSSDKKLMESVRRELNVVLLPVVQRLQAVEKLGAKLRTTVEVATQELGLLRALPTEAERTDELEQAVITLAHRVTAMQSELDDLIQGIASIGTEAPTRRHA